MQIKLTTEQLNILIEKQNIRFQKIFKQLMECTESKEFMKIYESFEFHCKFIIYLLQESENFDPDYSTSNP